LPVSKLDLCVKKEDNKQTHKNKNKNKQNNDELIRARLSRFYPNLLKNSTTPQPSRPQPPRPVFPLARFGSPLVGAPISSTTPRNLARRANYAEKKNIATAKDYIDSPSPTKKRFANDVLSTALKSKRGRKKVGGLARLLDQELESTQQAAAVALRQVVSSFPQHSKGRAQIVGTATGALSCHGDKQRVRKILGVQPGYARRAEKKISSGESATITSACGKKGRKWSIIGKIEGREILGFFHSHASARSGQKGRKWGETLHTEQYLWRLYARYTYLQEALESSEYAGEIPEKVTVHQANCWHAFNMEVATERL
jgi:hypothetical protein